MTIAFTLLCIVASLCWTSIYSYFATLTTHRLSTIGDDVYDLEWYGYPLNLQKYMILAINRCQKPFYFTGFNLCGCTLEVFGKVIMERKI